MIKFVDILKEQEEIIQVPKLDTPINRKLMNFISKKFDFDYFRQQADKWNLGHKSHILFNRYMKGDDQKNRDLPYNNMEQFMDGTLALPKSKIRELAFLLITNLKVENWLTDPILEPYDYYYYTVDYYDDYVSDEEEEDCETCDECGGSGYEDEDCGYCDGEGEVNYECGTCDGAGSITDDEGEEEECDTCGGSGNEEEECDECHGGGRSNEDCHWCGGETEICETHYYKQLDKMKIKLISPVKLPTPGEEVGDYYTEDYTDWMEKVSEIDGVIVLGEYHWDQEQDEYDPDNDNYKSELYEKANKIDWFDEEPFRKVLEKTPIHNSSHPFKFVVR